MSNQEIERKFLLSRQPEDLLAGADGTAIRQGYLAALDDRDIRVRDKAGSYFMTVKIGSGLVRGETEIGISQDQFDALWPLTAGARVEKKRFKLAVNGYIMELDVFGGDLDGFVMAEVEFPSVSDAEAWQVPDFVKKDVTEDKRYKNVNLALDGKPAER